MTAIDCDSCEELYVYAQKLENALDSIIKEKNKLSEDPHSVHTDINSVINNIFTIVENALCI